MTTGQQARKSLLNSTAMTCVRGFGHDEDGASGLFSFYVTLMLLLMAGLGVDTMRHEMERTHLQATLDAAVLAGAGAPQGTNVQGIANIVEDYFDKNNMSEFLHEIDLEGDDADIVASLNATSVYAEASMEVDTYLLQMTGVESLNANGAAQAEVATPKLEVAMVLDVSGSMEGIKLTNLQTAAKSFVTTILNQSDVGNAVISVVPFSWNVTPTDVVYNALTINESHEYSSCLNFEAADYNDPAIDPTVAHDQQLYTSVYDFGFESLDDEWRSCYADGNAELLPYSMSETALHTHIDALTADGNTSAHIGMKWGAAMLDSKFQSVVTSLQTANVVDDSLSNLPAVYGEQETLKIIVLMADGQNTVSYHFDENGSYVGADSDLYEFTFEEVEFEYGYSVYNEGRRYYESWAEGYCHNWWFECVYEASGTTYSTFYLRDGSWYYDIENNDWLDSYEIADVRASDEYVEEERHTWEFAWGKMSPHWYGSITGDWGPWNDYVGSSNESGSTKDTRMQAICSATKDEGVIVYTIGYDIAVDGNAETQLEDCASSLNHYYPTDGANISGAFNSIASNVKNLRLTQ